MPFEKCLNFESYSLGHMSDKKKEKVNVTPERVKATFGKNFPEENKAEESKNKPKYTECVWE